MNPFMSRESVEFLYSSLDVMLGDSLASSDGSEVDIEEDPLVVGYCLQGYVETQIRLRLGYRQPQTALLNDLGFGRPDALHGCGCIARGQDIGNVCAHRNSLATSRRLPSAADRRRNHCFLGATGLQGNIPAMVRTLESDQIDCCVGALASLVEIGTNGRD